MSGINYKGVDVNLLSLAEIKSISIELLREYNKDNQNKELFETTEFYMKKWIENDADNFDSYGYLLLLYSMANNYKVKYDTIMSMIHKNLFVYDAKKSLIDYAFVSDGVMTIDAYIANLEDCIKMTENKSEIEQLMEHLQMAILVAG